MGRLIPAGTGMEYYRAMKIEPDRTVEDYEEEEIEVEEIRVEAKEVGD